jgi:hypothetical protein
MPRDSGGANDVATDVAIDDVGAAADASAPPDVSVSADASAFCSDPTTPQLAVNGVVAASPAVMATANALNCCDSATIRVDTQQFSSPIFVTWRSPAGMSVGSPTVDLANLPAGWMVSVVDGCDPLQPGCVPEDRYDTGLTGSLTIARNAAGQLLMTTCLAVAETQSAPHPVVHSLQLWAPSVAAQ